MFFENLEDPSQYNEASYGVSTLMHDYRIMPTFEIKESAVEDVSEVTWLRYMIVDALIDENLA